MKHVVKKIHFIGIGGVGMSGIAEVLLTQGYSVSGSDQENNVATQRLANMGAQIVHQHHADNIADANVVVVSSAIQENNPEIIAARQAQIPIVPRAVMLRELMRLKQGIAIAGTHGKTTTTSLVASILAEGGLDPTFVIGGRLTSAGANARLGTGDFIVAEADESDASFLDLFPVIEVITNIDADHMDRYGQDLTCLKQAFIDFTKRLPFYGIAVVCIDDANVREILPLVEKPILRYGFSEEAQIRAINVKAQGANMCFDVLRNGYGGYEGCEELQPLSIQLNLPGEHNVQNALAAIAIATELEVSDEAIKRALKEFTGVARRFQHYGELTAENNRRFILIDDYAHHPVEMAATITATRHAYPGKRLVLVFQPHRYTRTRDCFEDLVKVLSTVDLLILGEVYPAGELPIVAADGRSLARALRLIGKVEPIFIEKVEQMAETIYTLVHDGDVVITMGAGSIGRVAPEYIKQRHHEKN